MNITLVKRSSALLAVSAFLFSFASFVPANFSGTWSLNEGKSEFGEFGRRGANSKLVIEQKDDSITFTRSGKSFTGEDLTVTEVLSSDGKELENTVFGIAKKKSSLHWAADAQTFTITYTIAFERGGQTLELKGTENWSLGADGKTLSLQTAISSPQGDVSTKALYDKQ